MVVIPFAFLLAFAGMWAGVTLLLAHMSGWRALAARYKTDAPPEGERRSWASARLNEVSFSSCLNLAFGPRGLRVEPMLLYRLFMPALLIPWADVRFARFGSVLGFQYAEFRLGGPEGPVFQVPRGLAEALFTHLTAEQKALFASQAAATPLQPRWRRLAYAVAFGAVLSAVAGGFMFAAPRHPPAIVILFPLIFVPFVSWFQDR